MISHKEIRKKYLNFFKARGHSEIPSASLVPQGDPTTLFTGSGMQAILPYLLGEKHPLGKRLVNIQPCFRSQDIDEIGDNRHTTMFEMIGNWSLGDYFKKEQLEWFFKFLTDSKEGLGLDPHKLYVTVFNGYDSIKRDTETLSIWKDIFLKHKIHAEIGDRIFLYGAEKNWWSRAGVPENMPEGEPGGPDSEVFYQFDIVHNPLYGKTCHPNCDCGRFLEIGNSVFMQYIKSKNNSFSQLSQKNVDFGGGLERICSAVNDTVDIFKTDLYEDIIRSIEKETNVSYTDQHIVAHLRRIADHAKASIFLIRDGVIPSNKEQGYFLRRLLRKMFLSFRRLFGRELTSFPNFENIINAVIRIYENIYFVPDKIHSEMYLDLFNSEYARFASILKNAKSILNKLQNISGKDAFNLYQSYGIPFEVTSELAKEKNISISFDDYKDEVEKHRSQSRKLSSGIFKGGLADSSDKTIQYHTATHLLHQVLRTIFGESVRQEGSHITHERLRFDYRYKRVPTNEEIILIEKKINELIKKDIPVRFIELDKKEAQRLGALSYFREKYPNIVKVYYIGQKEGDVKNAYSKEFCGGPHVTSTGKIGKIKVFRIKKIGENIIRIYMK